MLLKRKDYFDFTLKQVKHTSELHGDKMPQAFGRWFSNMFFQGVINVAIPDGAGDGKVDALVSCQVGSAVRYHILNSKFTNQYDNPSPASFYDEITRYWQAFENKSNRAAYLKSVVREPLRPHYKKLFKLYDEGSAKLHFLTNHRINENGHASVKAYKIDYLYLDDVLEYVAEHLEGAMPETEPLLLSGISNVLTATINESEVPTSIVFARLIDFIKYMEDDPFELLFARNVRLWLGKTETNEAIQKTFREHPEQFAYSNNGITILCKNFTPNPLKQELLIENPRVVNGSQTLHSVKKVDSPDGRARVMVRIIVVPRSDNHDVSMSAEKRKEIIHRISIRSNQQNPIKRWNLVANDDFQNELSRYFWTRKVYYERRQNEWKDRKLQLTSIGLEKGPDIRWMTQLIAAYHFDRKKLGPAVAQGQLNTLFEEDTYAIIRNTRPPLAYQIYLLSEICGRSLKRLSGKRRYIENVYGYVDLCLFALLCKIVKGVHIELGKEAVGKALEGEYDSDAVAWERATKGLVDYILADFRAASAATWKSKRKILTPANYFKNATWIEGLIAKQIPQRLCKIASDLKSSME